MNCVKCGKKINGSEMFCKVCGTNNKVTTDIVNSAIDGNKESLSFLYKGVSLNPIIPEGSAAVLPWKLKKCCGCICFRSGSTYLTRQQRMPCGATLSIGRDCLADCAGSNYLIFNYHIGGIAVDDLKF